RAPLASGSSASLRSRFLADLAPDVLLRVLDALALVGIRLPQAPELGRELAEKRLVGALQCDRHLPLHLRLNAFRQGKDHGMGVSQRQLDVPSLELRPIANTHDLQLTLESVLDAVHHVGEKRANQAMERADRPLL